MNGATARRLVGRCVSATVMIVSLVGGAASAPAATEDTTDVTELVRIVDRLYRAETSYAQIEMTIQTPNWTRTMAMDIWTRGMDDTFIRITAPKKDAGMATLRRKTEMWNYFPKIDRVMKVPPSMMMSSWMGSDFTNDDLVKESTLLDDYTFRLIETSDPSIYEIELTPRQETITVWARIVLTVRKADRMPLLEVYYDENGNPTRRLEFRDVKTLGGRTFPTELTMTPLTKEGHRTVIRYLSAQFDEKIDDWVFSLRNLRRRR